MKRYTWLILMLLTLALYILRHRAQPPAPNDRHRGISRKGGGAMSAFEIVSLMLSLMTLLIFFGEFSLALLSFLESRNQRK